MIKLTYPKEWRKKRNFIDVTLAKERKVLLDFKEFIYHLTITRENAVKKTKKHTEALILAAQKVDRSNKTSKLQYKASKPAKKLIKLASLNLETIETNYISSLMNL